MTTLPVPRNWGEWLTSWGLVWPDDGILVTPVGGLKFTVSLWLHLALHVQLTARHPPTSRGRATLHSVADRCHHRENAWQVHGLLGPVAGTFLLIRYQGPPKGRVPTVCPQSREIAGSTAAGDSDSLRTPRIPSQGPTGVKAWRGWEAGEHVSHFLHCLQSLWDLGTREDVMTASGEVLVANPPATSLGPRSLRRLVPTRHILPEAPPPPRGGLHPNPASSGEQIMASFLKKYGPQVERELLVLSQCTESPFPGGLGTGRWTTRNPGSPERDPNKRISLFCF